MVAEDNAGNRGNVNSASVMIRIGDLNDNPPIFDKEIETSYEVFENASIGFRVAKVLLNVNRKFSCSGKAVFLFNSANSSLCETFFNVLYFNHKKGNVGTDDYER